MNLTRTLTVLGGVAALCAVTAASPAVATTALVTAGIGLFGGLPVIDAREGRRKRFGDDEVATAYRDKRQTSYEQQCCQSKSGHIYSNGNAFYLWETCESIGKRRGEKLISVPPQALNAVSYSVYGAYEKQCISPKAAAMVNSSVSACQEKAPRVQQLTVQYNRSVTIQSVTAFETEIFGVESITSHFGLTPSINCNVSFDFPLEPLDEDLFYDAQTDLPAAQGTIPTETTKDSEDTTKIIAGLGTVVGVGGLAAAVVGTVVGAKKVKDKCKSEEAINDDKVEMLASEDAPPSYTQAVEEIPSPTSQGAQHDGLTAKL